MKMEWARRHQIPTPSFQHVTDRNRLACSTTKTADRIKMAGAAERSQRSTTKGLSRFRPRGQRTLQREGGEILHFGVGWGPKGPLNIEMCALQKTTTKNTIWGPFCTGSWAASAKEGCWGRGLCLKAGGNNKKSKPCFLFMLGNGVLCHL